MRDLREVYDKLIELAPHPGFVFMNHGYAEIDRRTSFRWLDPRDTDQRYSANLVHQLFGGIAVDGRQVLDIGCGRGGTCSYLARYHRPKKIVGLDTSLANVAFCRRVHDDPRLEFVHGDAHALPFSADSFDVVSNIESSHLYEDIEAFVREAHRVLRVGGELCYADLMLPEQVAPRLDLFARAGFDCVADRDITPNVARALHRDRRGLRGFLEKLLTDDNQDSLTALYTEIYYVVYPRYERGLTCYRIFKLRKSAGR